jgi:hypothetical protein
MVIQQNSGEVTIIKPGCGGLQGDSAMAQKFSATYDPVLEAWINEKDEEGLCIKATDPVEGDKIDVGTTVLADDVCETNITTDAQHMLEVMLEVEPKSTEAFRKHINPVKLTENRDKAEHVPTFRNQGKQTGAKKQTTLLKEQCKQEK